MEKGTLPSLLSRTAYPRARFLLRVLLIVSLVAIWLSAGPNWHARDAEDLVISAMPALLRTAAAIAAFLAVRTLLDLADAVLARLAEARQQSAILTTTARQAAISNRSEVERNEEGKRVWKIWRDGQEVGAHTANELIKLVRTRQLHLTDHYFDPEVGDWMPLGAHPAVVASGV